MPGWSESLLERFNPAVYTWLGIQLVLVSVKVVSGNVPSAAPPSLTVGRPAPEQDHTAFNVTAFCFQIRPTLLVGKVVVFTLVANTSPGSASVFRGG